MVNTGRLSASKITTYEGCRMSYYLQYVKHVKVPQNVRLAFGGRIHYMLELFYKRNFKSAENFGKFWKWQWFSLVSGDLLRGKQKENLKVQEFQLKNDFILRIGDHVDLGPEPVGIFFGYMNLGERVLKNFYNRHIPEKTGENGRKPPVKTEFVFGRSKLNPVEIDGHLVTGVIDRIDEKDGKFWFTDYKTDKHAPKEDAFSLHRHPQFSLYSLVFPRLFGKKEQAILYYHLRTGQVLKTHRSEKDYDYIRGLLDRVARGVENNEFDPFYGFHCNFCDHKSACEQYTSDFHGGPRIDLEGKIKGAEEFTDWYSPDSDVGLPGWIESGEER